MQLAFGNYSMDHSVAERGSPVAVVSVVLRSNLLLLGLHNVIEEASLAALVGPQVNLLLVLSHWVIVESTLIFGPAHEAHLHHVTHTHRVVQARLCLVEFVLTQATEFVPARISLSGSV
jgi:hypothetical protein